MRIIHKHLKIIVLLVLCVVQLTGIVRANEDSVATTKVKAIMNIRPNIKSDTTTNQYCVSSSNGGNNKLCVTDWIDALSTLFSAIFAGCMVYYACKQTSNQKDNIKISLFIERNKIYTPIVESYNLYTKGLLHFFKLYCYEDKNTIYPIKAVLLQKQLENCIPQGKVLFKAERDELEKYYSKYKILVDKSCELCSYLTKVPKPNDSFNILLAVSESKTDGELRKKFEEIVKKNEKELLLPIYEKLEFLVKDFAEDNSIKSWIDNMRDSISIGNIRFED